MASETIVITGASRGIGEAIASRLAREGRRLLLLARTDTDLKRVRRLVRREGADCDYLLVDLSSRQEVHDTLDTLERDYQGVDTLVLNAGFTRQGQFLDSDADEVDYEFQVNFFAPTVFLRRLVRPMIDRGEGRAAVVGSLTSDMPFPGHATYSASKAALRALVRSLQLELADSDVHIGLVLPGFTRTAMTSELRNVLPAMSPESVAEAVEQCLEDRQNLVVPGLVNKLAFRLFGAMPNFADSLVARLPFLIPSSSTSEAEASDEPRRPPKTDNWPWPTTS
jgi:3-oxoacyl-[acyl-carrier protein] reductase